MLLKNLPKFKISFTPFNYQDPLSFESNLSEEEKIILDSSRNYAQNNLMPRILEATRKSYFDKEIMREMGSLGFLGCTIKEYDLPGVSYVSYGLLNREIERVDSGYRSALSVQSSLVMHPIMTFGTQEQKDKFIPRLATGELIGCFGLTEPNAGSGNFFLLDPSGMQTRAVLKGDHYVLNGTKTWITNSPIADVFVVWAKDDNGDIRGFLLEKSMKGLSAPEIEGKMSLKSSITGQIVMDDVSKGKYVSESQRAQRTIFMSKHGKTWDFLGQKANLGAIGAGEFCLHQARQYTLERKQFGSPLCANQLIQKKMADIASELSLALQGAYQVTRNLENGNLSLPQISIVKRNSCAKALDAARQCRDMLGGNGIVDEYHIFRHMVNLETVNTYEGTSDIHSLIIGSAITGIQAYTPK